jgi:hypothetical protein
MVIPAPQVSPLRSARPLGCEEFRLRDLSRVTDGFSNEKKIGCGSFGSVYRARLPDGREVAIKRAERSGSGGRRRCRFDAERAFRVELWLLSRVNHRNLVQLLGFCEERGERILVFEFMPHDALHGHLHCSSSGNDGRSPLFASMCSRCRWVAARSRSRATPSRSARSRPPAATSSSRALLGTAGRCRRLW